MHDNNNKNKRFPGVWAVHWQMLWRTSHTWWQIDMFIVVSSAPCRRILLALSAHFGRESNKNTNIGESMIIACPLWPKILYRETKQSTVSPLLNTTILAQRYHNKTSKSLPSCSHANLCSFGLVLTDHRVQEPCKQTITGQNWARNGPMLPTSGRFRLRFGTLWHVYWEKASQTLKRKGCHAVCFIVMGVM